MNVKFANNTSKWQMGFNSEFKGLIAAVERKGTTGLHVRIDKDMNRSRNERRKDKINDGNV
jgi:hypothetical protein